MVKTNAPSSVTVAGQTFETNALPDPFDANDLIYRPRLQVLPPALDHRAGEPILDQVGNSCTGHAVAALINTVRSVPKAGGKPAHGSPRTTTVEVSPYMLYAMARRYDEFPGQEDVGSSLRGAFKGWFRHGVCLAESWSADVQDRDLYDPDFMRECADVPLGAYYRVNVQRIDDMQSALTELNAIAVSAAIHTGWREPKAYARDGKKPMWVIERSAGIEPLGGHAFLLAGYNDIGFLVQNSWGQQWGYSGYATLPYEDWLDNGYDAWVGRPGVPQTLFVRPRQWSVATSGGVVSTTGPNLQRLPKYVIDVVAGGLPSSSGKVTSSPSQIAELAASMAGQHEEWARGGDTERHVVIYAHGGLVDENGGIRTADRMIDWWLANHVYPIHVTWESGAPDTIISFLRGHLDAILPFGGPFDGVWERVDRRLEAFGRKFRPLWEEMKANARASSAPLSGRPIDWLHKGAGTEPGVSLLVDRLKTYRADHPELKIHLVGHSAGSVLLASALRRLVAEGIDVESMQLMGGAIRVDEFVEKVMPELATGRLGRFATFDLTDRAEQNDQVPGPPIALYHKSLLYLVARSLEKSDRGEDFEVPMVGLSRYLTEKFRMPDGGVRPLIDAIGGDDAAVIAPNDNPERRKRSRAAGHGEFDDDPDTLTAVLLRMLGRKEIGTLVPYPKGGMASSRSSAMPLPTATGLPAEPGPIPSAAGPGTASDQPGRTATDAVPVMAGGRPGPAAAGRPTLTATDVAAPTEQLKSPFEDALSRSGYRPAESAAPPTPPARRNRPS